MSGVAPDAGGDAARTPPPSFWDRRAAPQAAAVEHTVPLGTAAGRPDQTFTVGRDRLRPWYVGFLVGLLMVAAAANRAGSWSYFAGAGVVVVLGAVQLSWWRSRSAACRVELIDGGETLSVVTPRGTSQVPVADLIKIDQDASPVAQLFGWPELTLHHAGGQLRIGRPHDSREFFWQLSRSNRSVDHEPPRTQQRPWIVAVAVGIILLGVVSSALLAAVAAGQSSTRTLGLTVVAICLARVWLCIRLWTGSRRAWRIFTALALAGVVIGLTSTHVSAASLGAEVLVLAVLTCPGVRNWASD